MVLYSNYCWQNHHIFFFFHGNLVRCELPRKVTRFIASLFLNHVNVCEFSLSVSEVLLEVSIYECVSHLGISVEL